MEFAVKRFARNILLLHLLLLAVVLALVFFASRAIRDGAREQAQQQAESRQRMLANQTARGIEAFYHSILADMNLVPDQDDSETERGKLGSILREISREFSFPAPGATQPTTQPTHPTTRPATLHQRASGPPMSPRSLAGGGQRPGSPPSPNKPRQAKGLLVGQLLGRQLEERVTHLFVVGRRLGPPPPPPPKGAPKPATPPKRDMELVLADVIVEPSTSDEPNAKALMERYQSWLLAVKEQSISKFELFGNHGFNLVAMPVSDGRALLVAAVPVSTITEQFLSAINSDPNTGVMLVNDSLTVMAASRPKIVGANVESQGDADLQANLEAFKSEGFKGSRILNHPFALAGEKFDPSLLTAEPIDVAGRKWFIVVGSPLSQVDAVVAQVFGRLVVWAVFVVIAITGILLSTAIQMIRTRLRVERVRSEAIRKELDRARHIQQAWLPRTAPQSLTIDLAAVNFPAHHISGDFYNWFELHDGRIAVVIGDVTGHGMSAAFLMATTQLLVRTTMQRITDPAECLTEVNRQLCTLMFNGQFVTLQVLVLDPDGGPLEICSAGHPAPLIADPAAKDPAAGFRPLPIESQLVLGVDPDAHYETTTLNLPPFASLLLFTDGAIDLLAPNGKRLGNDGLHHTCPPRLLSPKDTAKRGDAKAMLDAVVHATNHFRGSRELDDDLTFVAIRLTQPSPATRPELAGVA
jgi:serine phosphatase RsbU (regulator of sigma subunit)